MHRGTDEDDGLGSCIADLVAGVGEKVCMDVCLQVGQPTGRQPELIADA